MAARSQAYVTPSIIRWGRQRARTSRTAIAEKLKIQEDKIAEWEKGEDYPTMRQARLLADVLDIPFGYLFLSGPPQERVPIRDFRTIGGKPVENVSLELFDVLNDVLGKQEWYHDFLVEEGAEALAFVGKFTTATSVAEVATDIRNTLKIGQALRGGVSSADDFLRMITSNAEDAGVLVMRSGVVRGNPHRSVSVKECRGFAICDGVAPVVFINGADAKAAQIFTLAHELAHIWIGQSGISNPDLIEHDQRPTIESFCNEVAAEVLVPASDFLERWKTQSSVDDNVATLGRHYKVSSLVILRRAHDLRKIGKKDYLERFKSEYQRFREKEQQTGGGNYYLNVPSWNSKTLTATIVGAALDGRVPFREAAQLLNVRVPVIHELAKHL